MLCGIGCDWSGFCCVRIEGVMGRGDRCLSAMMVM